MMLENEIELFSLGVLIAYNPFIVKIGLGNDFLLCFLLLIRSKKHEKS
jgi:hypothetical protein